MRDRGWRLRGEGRDKRVKGGLGRRRSWGDEVVGEAKENEEKRMKGHTCSSSWRADSGTR